MGRDFPRKRVVTANDVIKELSKNGLEVSEKEAEEILEFLFFLGKLTVNQYFNNDKKQSS